MQEDCPHSEEPRKQMDEATERALLLQARDGDWPAFDALVKGHQKRVYYLAFRLTGTHEGADTVTHEVFIRAFKALRKFDGRSRWMTWLYTIVTRVVQDRHRYLKARRTPASLSEQMGIAHDRRRPSPAGPPEALDRKELRDALADGLEGLPLEQRTALSLVVQEGLSYQDAAGVLGCSEGTLAWRIWEARRRLRDLLACYFEP